MADSTWTEGLGSARTGDAPRSDCLYRLFDADAPAGASGRFALTGVDRVVLGRADARGATRRLDGDVHLLQLDIADRWMSGKHASLTRVLRSWVLEDTQSKNGVRLNGELVQRAELQEGDVFELGRTFFLFRAAQALEPQAPQDLESDALEPPAPGLATLAPPLAARFAELARVAPSQVTVAIDGPSGAGKEVVARALHALSKRRGPFVAVNCGALPAELVESELFGHKKGAFSGATEDRPGLVRAAHGGTLFLDEVGDLPLQAQPALLRVLQERQVTAVGSTSPVPVDVRIVSATHRRLEALAAREQFRDDLRARLTGYQLTLPSLHERREDLGLLMGALLGRLAPGHAVRLAPPAARALALYGWPLNVRELEKALETAAVLAGSAAVELQHLPEAVRQATGRPAARPADDDALKAQLEAQLLEHGGNISAVARAMGKARVQVQRWIARFGLDARAFKR